MPALRRDRYTPEEGYDVGDLARRRYLGLVVRRAGLFPGEEALVVQCGLGQAPTALANRFTRCDVVATDSREELLDEARRHAEEEGVRDRIRFYQAEPDDLPFRAERFIVAVTDLALHAAPDPLAVLEEMHRVTDYAGKLFAVDVDFTRSRARPEGAHENVLGPETQEAMREIGWGKVAVQKVDLLRDGGVLYLLQAKRFDPEETATG